MLPAYFQSGARHLNSKFVLTLEAGDNLDRTRAISIAQQNSEPSIKQLYGTEMERRDNGKLQDEPDDGVSVAEEPSDTGATLHASGAISFSTISPL